MNADRDMLVDLLGKARKRVLMGEGEINSSIKQLEEEHGVPSRR